MITKDDFVQFVVDHIKDYLPEENKDGKIVVEEVVKFNEKYVGLTIGREETEAVPCLNLDMFYEMHKSGEALDDLLIKMAEVFKIPSISIDLAIFNDYDKAKEHLMLRVCNATYNQDYLRTVVHTEVADLAITYGIAFAEEDGYRIAPVKPDMIEEWGVSKDKLHEDAARNSLKIFPPLLFNLADVIPSVRFPNNLLEEDKAVDKATDRAPFYVLTNTESFEGASVLFYPEMMGKAAMVIGDDYTIIPSSIHEVLLISDSAEISLSELKSMIRAANDMSGTIKPHEILGYEPYHYDSESKTFETAESFARRAKKESLDARIASAEEKLADEGKRDKEREGIKDGERENDAI